MGTNYYAYVPPCSHCGHQAEPLHIGKSSFGWCFALHHIPELHLNGAESWLSYLSRLDVTIKDEYGRVMTVEEMRGVILDRKADKPQTKRWLKDNYAVEGPNNLARSKKHIVTHGNTEPWDLVEGKFS